MAIPAMVNRTFLGTEMLLVEWRCLGRLSGGVCAAGWKLRWHSWHCQWRVIPLPVRLVLLLEQNGQACGAVVMGGQPFAVR